MARIPTEEELDRPAPSAGRALTAIDGGMQKQMLEPARALVDLGQSAAGAVTAVTGAIQKRREADDDYAITKTMLAFDRQQERAYEEAKRNMPDGGDGFADGWRKGFDTEARNVFASAKAQGLQPHSLAKLDENLLRWGERLHTRATRDELTERGRFHTDDVYRQLTDIENRVAENPARVHDMINASRALVESNRYLPQATRHKLLRQYPSMLEEIAARTEIDRDPERAIRALQRRPHGDVDTSNDPGYEAATGQPIRATPTAYSPKKGGDKMEGGYAASKPGPGDDPGNPKTWSVKTLDDVANGRSDYVTLAGDSSQYGKSYIIPQIPYIDASGQQKMLTNVKAVVHDTGSAFRGAPEGRYDIPITKDADDKLMSANHNAWSQQGITLLPVKGTRQTGQATAQRGQPGGGATNEADMYGGETTVPSAGPVGPDSEPLPQWSYGEDAAYRHLHFKDRQKLLNVARVSLRDTVTRQVSDDIELIRDGKAPSRDAEGRTSIERAGLVMTQNQMSKLKGAWQEADLEAKVLLPLRQMSEAEALDHLAKHDPGDAGDGEGYKVRDKVFTKAVKQWDKIQAERSKDFAAAAETAPEVKRAREMLRNQIASKLQAQTTGEDRPQDKLVSRVTGPVADVSPQTAWGTIIEARYAAQRRMMGRSADDKSTEGLRPITRSESIKLLGISDPKDMDDGQLSKALRVAADKAEQAYGPKYGRDAMKTAIFYLLKSKENRDAGNDAVRSYWSDTNTQARAAVMEKVSAGEQLTISDRRALRDLDGATAPARALDRQSSMEFDQPTGMGRFTGSTSARVKPSPPQLEWLKQSPKERGAIFDQKFGTGAAAAALASQER